MFGIPAVVLYFAKNDFDENFAHWPIAQELILSDAKGKEVFSGEWIILPKPEDTAPALLATYTPEQFFKKGLVSVEKEMTVTSPPKAEKVINARIAFPHLKGVAMAFEAYGTGNSKPVIQARVPSILRTQCMGYEVVDGICTLDPWDKNPKMPQIVMVPWRHYALPNVFKKGTIRVYCFYQGNVAHQDFPVLVK